MWGIYAIFKKLPNVNDPPTGENSFNLVALLATDLFTSWTFNALTACVG
jgi:hypothetical protein